jgi:DNA-binding transcriptional regulator LsrR (DeoR family)
MQARVEKYFNVMVTDEQTARYLLNENQNG